MKDEEKKIPAPADSTGKAHDPFRPDSDLPPDADAEERFNDFWKKNGVMIFGAIAVVAIVITGVQGFELLQERNQRKVQAVFAEANSNDARLTFAADHPDHPLAGVALLEVADAEYAAGDFLQAANHYQGAIEPLAEAQSPLAGRARLGAAMALLRQGDDEALLRLDDIARDAEVIETVRAQAAYHRAVVALERDDDAAARSALDLLGSFDAAPRWQADGERLAARLPAREPSATASDGLTLGE